MDSRVNVTAAEVQPLRNEFLLCCFQGNMNQIVNAPIFAGGNRNYRNGENVGNGVQINIDIVLADFVHHVESQDHGDFQLHQLKGQVEISLQIGGIQDVDQYIGMLMQENIPGRDVVQCIGRKRVGAWEFDDIGSLMPLHRAFFGGHFVGGKIPVVLEAPGHLIKEGGKTSAWIADKADVNGHDSSALSTIICLASSFRRVS